MHTLKRNYQQTIPSLLELFPAVVLLGARQVGKSTLVKSLLPKAKYFDLEKEQDYNRIEHAPELVFNEFPNEIIFDEAQRLPKLFQYLRVEIDKNREKNGRFLITGSSSPELLKHINESLAGRCAIVQVNGLAWNEAAKKPMSTIYQMIANKNIKQLHHLNANQEYIDLLQYCLIGAYPEVYVKKEHQLFIEQWRESYVQSYIERDIRSLFPNLNINTYRRFVKMSALATGEILNYSNFSRSLDISQPSIKHYFDILEGTFIWRTIPAYDKNLKKRMIKMPKGYIKDTGLVNHFMNIASSDDLISHPKFGHIWESFVIEQIIKGFKESLIKCDFYHYRTSNHSEIDLILEGNFGIVPIEIKSSTVTSKKQLRTMENFIKENDLDYGLLINNAEEIYPLSEKIYQIPAKFL